LAKQGFFVFPIRHNDKRPLIEDWEEEASIDPKKIEEWWTRWPNANIATAPGRHECMVIDLDVKHGIDGIENFRSLQLMNGDVPKTLLISTPSGGLHYWFGIPSGRGIPPSSVGRIMPGIDVRASGGYVLLPPSTVGGSVYRVTEGVLIADAPDWLIQEAEKRKTEPQAAPANVQTDSPGNRERAIDFLKSCAPAIEGEGGDTHTVKTAMELRDLGLSKESALALIQEHFNPRCIPPWEPDELAVKVANAFRYGANEPGAYAVGNPHEVFAEFLKSLPRDTTPADGPILFRDVLARAVPPVWELVPGLIEKGTVTFLSAPGGSHKSRVALQWGLSVDAGKPVFGRSVERARFVYVSYEDHADEVARRAQAIARRLTLPTDSAGEFWDLSGKDSPLAVIRESSEIELRPFWNSLHAHLKTIPGHKFVVIDSTYNALRFEGSAKINEGSVMAGIGLLQRLCDETDTTLLVLWHPSQAGQDRGDASGWSVAWHNAPRSRLSLTPVKDTEDAFELKVEKRNHGAKGKPVTLYWSDGILLPRSEAATVEQGARFLDACVSVAIQSAEQGSPIQKQRRLNVWMLDTIESRSGFRPSDREVKEALARAMSLSLLRYAPGTKYQTAGYYPVDPNRAGELAREAKHLQRAGASDA
jgi:hypothetical protein